MTIDTDEELQKLRAAGRVVARCLRQMIRSIEVGMTTVELDDIGRDFLTRHGARSAPEVSYEFPGATCISVNEEVAHGIPGERRIAAGDLVHVDVSAELDGFYGDCGATHLVPPAQERARQLVAATRKALRSSMSRARDGRSMRELGREIERVAQSAGFGVIRNLGSHGIGRSLHDEPKFVPGFDDPREKRRLAKGTVMTLEPFLTTGRSEAVVAGDGWTLLNEPGSWTAQFEHTLVVTKNKPIILTRP